MCGSKSRDSGLRLGQFQEALILPVQPEDIPETMSPSGGLCRHLVAGEQGAAFQDRTDFSIVDIELPNLQATYTLEVPDGFTHVIVYAYQGKGRVSGTTVLPQHAAVMVSPDGLLFRPERHYR